MSDGAETIRLYTEQKRPKTDHVTGVLSIPEKAGERAIRQAIYKSAMRAIEDQDFEDDARKSSFN